MLRVTIAVNRWKLADYEIRRVTATDRHPGPNEVLVYEVRTIPEGVLVGSVRHRYGDGAHALAIEVLALTRDYGNLSGVGATMKAEVQR